MFFHGVVSIVCVLCVMLGVQPRLPLNSIPVSRPFDRVGVDVLQLPKKTRGKKYVDYLTKWVEVFTASDQSTVTIASLLVEHNVPCNGVPTELLSDRGRAFCSKLTTKIYTTFWGFASLKSRSHGHRNAHCSQSTLGGGLEAD